MAVYLNSVPPDAKLAEYEKVIAALEGSQVSPIADIQLRLQYVDAVGLSGKNEGWEKGVGLLKELDSKSAQTLGDQHPLVWQVKHRLGSRLVNVGRYEEARLLLQEVYRWRRPRFGIDSREALATFTSLSESMRSLNRLNKFSELDDVLKLDLLDRRNHSDHLRLFRELALVLINLGRHREAEVYLSKSVELAKETLGETTRPALVLQSSLADLHVNFGDYDRAAVLLTDVIAKADGHAQFSVQDLSLIHI